MTLIQHIEARADAYANIELFRAFADDTIPVERFTQFFPEMAMVSRIFQDLIWALTEIFEGEYAEFAARHRKRDSGHHKWMVVDLKNNDLPAQTLQNHFCLELLDSRVQMARLLALTHDADPETRMVMLCALEKAGEITLGTLHRYAARNGLLPKTQYLGTPHMRIETAQVEDIHTVAPVLLGTNTEAHLQLIDEVFDALTTLFHRGGRRYYADLFVGDIV